MQKRTVSSLDRRRADSSVLAYTGAMSEIPSEPNAEGAPVGQHVELTPVDQHFEPAVLPEESAPRIVRPPFWRRILAFCIDGLIIGIVCITGGFIAGEWYAALGPWGRLVGGAIGVCYFGFGASALAGGQTPGKKWMRILVRRRDGGHLSLPASFARATVLMLPIACNGLAIDLSSTVLVILATIIVFGVGIGIFYLFLFNRRTRESVHDLATRSIVVPFDFGNVQPIESAPARLHFIVVGIVLLVSVVVSPIAMWTARSSATFAPLLVAQKDIVRLVGSGNVQIFYGTMVSTGANQTWVRTSVMTYSAPADQEKLATKIAATVLRDIPSARSRSAIIVILSQGYDILFASSFRSYSWSYSPAEWQKRIEQAR
jgi:uncharacterized RDD family membrane protein YckC